MKNHFLKAIVTAAFLFAVGIVTSANAQTVSGSIGNGTIKPGVATRGTVVLNIPGGLHVNSSRPGSEYAIPTSVRVTSSGGVRVGAVSYPRGKNRKFGFSEDTINVYEGRTRFSFNVTVPKNYRNMAVKVNVTVRYQACTDEVCYPPKSKKLTLTATVL